ncbi:JAB1/Mov34/MPN/PAD-1 ubiquitin protease-domain-containing protein [Blastocladiella britannica]|nr:JAB1/Mov34/MPN/PAD-1 ubiquitin protease-domain-containing protein [Blastocladiella britannica]
MTTMANGVPVQVPTPASTGTTGAAAAQPPPPNRVALVMVPSSALQGYMIHATTTAHEEVMGLILGDWIDIPPTSMEDTATPESIADVMCFLVQRRLDKRPDRVELAPEQLIEAAAHAEQLSVTTGKRVRVIGWYHSHPNITVQPSHVDVGTQRTQQLMDGRFIGLIMSVFHSDHSTHAQQQRLIAFQTNNMVNTFLPIPISVYYDPISPPTAAMLASVPRTLYGELVDEHDRLVGAGTAAVCLFF